MAILRSVLLAVLAAGLLPATLFAQSMPATNQEPASANNGQPQELVDPGVIYNDKNPGDWVGKSVTLKNVMVQDTNKGESFWVGSDNHHRLLVVKSDENPNVKELRLRKGDIVTITGTVQPASNYEAKETGAKKGTMHDAENSSGIFLMANNISVSSSTAH